MATIIKNSPATVDEIKYFLKEIKFSISDDFVNFYKESNGGEISTNECFVILWKLTDMVQWNIDYQVSEYASNFFMFGSDGAGIAYSIERTTGFIFEFDFICMSNDDAIFINKTFSGFIQNLPD